MTRIIAGVARGRPLAVPASGTRPTSDRVREAVFSSLESSLGGLAGVRVADLYAGSGAVGLEAVSRGAVHALLVERDRKAAKVISANIAAVGLPGVELQNDDVERVVSCAPSHPFDLIYIDPPYEVSQSVIEKLLADVAGNGWLAPQSHVVVERGARDAAVVWPDGFDHLGVRKYGDTVLVTGIWYGHDTAG